MKIEFAELKALREEEALKGKNLEEQNIKLMKNMADVG